METIFNKNTFRISQIVIRYPSMQSMLSLIFIASCILVLLIDASKDCIKFGGQFNVFLDSKNVLRQCKLPDGIVHYAYIICPTKIYIINLKFYITELQVLRYVVLPYKKLFIGTDYSEYYYSIYI